MEAVATFKLMLLALAMQSNQPIEVTIPAMPDCDKMRFEDETTCTACNLYHEARSETKEGMIAVANVTRNRVDSDRFPDNFCAVVWQRRQFSWTKDGKSDKVRHSQSWKDSYEIAKATVESYRSGTMAYNDNTNGSLWYHADYVSPRWSRTKTPDVTIGRHEFYTTVALDTDLK